MGEFVKKYKVLLGIELILVIVLLLGCILKKEELIVSENPAEWSYGSDGKDAYYKCDNFVLEAGVYRLTAQTVEKACEMITVGMRGEGSSYNAVRSNDITFVPGTTYVEFEVYVIEPLKNASLVMLCQGQEPAVLKNVSLYSTNIGNRILLFEVIMASILLNGVILLRKKIISGGISKESLTAGFLVMGSILVASIPLMVDYFVAEPDTLVKLFQIESYGESVKSLHLILPAILRLIGFHIMTAYKAYIFSVIAFMGILLFWILKKISGNLVAAAVGSTAYTLATGRLLALYGVGGENPKSFMYFACLNVGVFFVVQLVKWCEKRKKESYKYSATIIGLIIFLLCRGIYEMNVLIFEAAPVRIYNIEKLGAVTYSAEDMYCFEEWAALLIWLLLYVLIVGGKRIKWNRKNK